jgi:hypothetical protein
MTTMVEARAELITALTTAGARATSKPGDGSPPYVLVQFDGGDPAHIMRGAVQADYRLTLIGGLWDAAAAAEQLDTLCQTVLTTLRELPGWIVGTMGRDGGRDWKGATYLTRDVSASRAIDL